MKRNPSLSLLLAYLPYALVRFLDLMINIIPEPAAFAVGRFIGRSVFVMMPDRREAAMENLTIAFGSERSPEWIRMTARKSFEHVGMIAIEFFRIRNWSEELMAERFVIEGKKDLNLMMLPGQHGICFLYSHFGAFELGPATTKFVGARANLIVSGLRNRFLSRYLFTRGGKDTGLTIFPDRGIVEKMIELLRKGESVIFLADQRGEAERGIFVNFFGKPAPANEVFARIAIDGNARIVPLRTVRRDDGKYHTLFEPDVQVRLTGDRREDLTRLSQQFHDIFEKWLRTKPEQGFWLQRKWRRKASKKSSSQKRKKGSMPNRGTDSQGNL